MNTNELSRTSLMVRATLALITLTPAALANWELTEIVHPETDNPPANVDTGLFGS